MKKIFKLCGHHILCGCGTVGRVILQELVDSGAVVVVIDEHHDSLADYQGLERVICLEGDATDDEVLQAAGIDRAAGLAAALKDDKDNLFLIISAKQLRPDLRVASVASEVTVQRKLLRAGADSVISPAFVGGMRLASELMRPAVVGFLDKMLRNTESPVRFAQVNVGSAWFGKTLGQLDMPNTEGLPVLAVKLPGNEFLFNPSNATPLAKGMEIVTMGEISRVQQLMTRIGDTTAPTIIGATDIDDPGENDG
jgi:voltage-gated potassium channel